MHLETLAHGHSLFHRLDPRGKLAVALAYSLVMATGQSAWAGGAGLGLCLAGCLAARLPGRELLKRLAAVNAFTALLWVMLPWQVYPAGDGWLGLRHHPPGIFLAGMITLKANAIVLGLTLLLATSTVNQVFHALAHWRISPRLLQVFFFFYRYLHVLHREWHRMHQAARARGFQPRTSWHTYRTYAYLTGGLLVRSYDRAQRVYQAMLCRGFQGTYWLLDHFQWQRRDDYFLLWGGLLVALLLVLELAA
ncbi:MAG: cobalt ECF transporter T component CbiQ [Desulfarculus sp.]|nr:cobalt ECF transporter T component CbiQ [Desulfarculus sp.]